MLKILLIKIFFLVVLLPFALFAQEKVAPPKYLYKIISADNWEKSQNEPSLIIADDDFVHLATEEQIDRIVKKYWSDSDTAIILKLETAKLKGRLAYETNPGGTTKYYHLYQGSIPRNAIIDVKRWNRPPT